jgi:hypothetical protein
MEYKQNKHFQLIKRGNLSNPEEKARVLRRYAGIFPDNIREFGEKITPRLRKQKNYSK